MALWLAVLLAAATALAQAPPRELLNSERIEQTFGTYGIEVLANSPRERLSRLYSTHDGLEVCRTFAVVMYPVQMADALEQEHAAIVAGGSIGATFADAGWRVVKRHRYFGTVAATPGLRRLMRSDTLEHLAVHLYSLSVARAGVEHEYAIIAEVHHPDYLTLDDLLVIYGPQGVGPGEVDSETSAAIARVEARLP